MAGELRPERNELTHVFIITTDLEGSKTQFEFEWFEGISVHFISGFDFRQKPFEELILLFDWGSFLRRYGQAPSSGAIGCAAAHRECYRRLWEEGGCCALVLEDDVSYGPSLLEAVREINDSALDYDVVNLCIAQGIFRPAPIHVLKFGSLYRASLYQFGAYAYLIHRDCAKRFLEIQRPVIKHLADWPLETWKFKCFGLHSSLTNFTGRPTTVQSAQLEIHPTFITRLIHRWRGIKWNLRRLYRVKFKKDLIIG